MPRAKSKDINCPREAADHPEHAERHAAFQVIPCRSILIAQTYKSGCGLSLPHSPSGQNWLCITDLHEVCWSGEGLATPISSHRPAPFITPADRLDLCTWEKKGKSNKNPTTHRAVCSKNQRLLHHILVLHSGIFWPELSSWPHLPWLSSKFCLRAHLLMGAQQSKLQLHMHIKKIQYAHAVQVSSQRTNFQLVYLSSSSNLLFFFFSSSLLFLHSIYWFCCKSEHQIWLPNTGLVTGGLWWRLLWAPGRLNVFFEKLHLFLDVKCWVPLILHV